MKASMSTSILLIMVSSITSIAMAQDTLELLEATSRGLVETEDPVEYLENSPPGFMEAMDKASAEAATDGNLFISVRIPVPRELINAPESERRLGCYKIATEAYKLGKVERTPGWHVPTGAAIYIILPALIGIDKKKFKQSVQGTFIPGDDAAEKKRRREGGADKADSMSAPFLETTEGGFQYTEDREAFLDEAPADFLEAYKKAEKESPGRYIPIRMKEGMTEEEVLDNAWKAYQKSRGFPGYNYKATDEL